jgi:hypothetical protein
LFNEFKTFTKDRLDIDQLVALAAFGRFLKAEYAQHDVEVPEWVNVQSATLKNEIRSRNSDRLEARRRQIESQLENLKTPIEKKADLLREKERIESRLKGIE